MSSIWARLQARDTSLWPEGNVAGGVTRHVEHLKARNLVSFAQLAVDRVRRPGAGAEEELGERVVGLPLADELWVLGGVGVGLPHPVGDRELGADAVACALVIGMGVGERVRGDLAALELLEDAAAVVARGGVDEDILEQVGVDRVRREARELPDAVSELLHPVR